MSHTHCHRTSATAREAGRLLRLLAGGHPDALPREMQPAPGPRPPAPPCSSLEAERRELLAGIVERLHPGLTAVGYDVAFGLLGHLARGSMPLARARGCVA
jgi:hypothetical protein